MSKHIIVSEETHRNFKNLAKKRGMKFDGLLQEFIDKYTERKTGIKDLSRIAYIPPKGGKIIGDTKMVYEVIGEHTAWDINCDCCGKEINNSTEIDIYIERKKDRARINACHYCNNTHIMPTLNKTEINGDLKPIQFRKYIIDKYQEKYN